MYEIENTLRDLLRRNIVSFTYRKVNGEIRHAIGTRNLSLAERYTETNIPTPTGDMQPNSYYDVERGGWRSWKEGNVISIDGCKIGWRVAETPKKDEPTKREIRISGKPMGGGIDIDKFGIDAFFGGNIPKEEVRKAMDDLEKVIVIGAPAHSPKVGTPTFTDKGVELEMGIGVEDFAKMVAHYVVEEIANRLKLR